MLKGKFSTSDGYHRLRVFDSKGVTSNFHATCACGEMERKECDTYEQGLIAYMNHLKGMIVEPKSIHLGVRTGILAASMYVVWALCYGVGRMFVAPHVEGSVYTVVVVGFSLLGLFLAFGLMVTLRRFLDPTKP